MIINKSDDYNKRRKEQIQKNRILKDVILNNLTPTYDCMSCLERKFYDYPLNLCIDCFNILYSPQEYFYTPFNNFYHLYKECKTVYELKNLLLQSSQFKEQTFINMSSAILNKIKNLIYETWIKNRYNILVEQYNSMNEKYLEIIEAEDVSSLISFKLNMTAILFEIERLEKKLRNVF